MGPLHAIDGDVILLPPFIYGSRFRVLLVVGYLKKI
jgi:hypothetical protein